MPESPSERRILEAGSKHKTFKKWRTSCHGTNLFVCAILTYYHCLPNQRLLQLLLITLNICKYSFIRMRMNNILGNFIHCISVELTDKNHLIFNIKSRSGIGGQPSEILIWSLYVCPNSKLFGIFFDVLIGMTFCHI